MSRPFAPRRPSGPIVRVNGKIRAREVRVVSEDGRQLGILPLGDAIRLAQGQGVDLVEVAPNATPPVCRIVDYGKYRYEQAKRNKVAHKHQHATKLKEIQLRPTIDPHDRQTKLNHAIQFLCDEMKVKISVRFRGREMAHQEIGAEVMNKFLEDLASFGHPDSTPKLAGRAINVILSPLPRSKRAKPAFAIVPRTEAPAPSKAEPERAASNAEEPAQSPLAENPEAAQPVGFFNNPFVQIQ